MTSRGPGLSPVQFFALGIRTQTKCCWRTTAKGIQRAEKGDLKTGVTVNAWEGYWKRVLITFKQLKGYWKRGTERTLSNWRGTEKGVPKDFVKTSKGYRKNRYWEALVSKGVLKRGTERIWCPKGTERGVLRGSGIQGTHKISEQRSNVRIP